MPKVNLMPDKDKYRMLSLIINGAVVYEGKTTNDVAKMLDVSEPTALKWLRKPELMTLETLCNLSRKLRIPIDDLRECVRY